MVRNNFDIKYRIKKDHALPVLNEYIPKSWFDFDYEITENEVIVMDEKTNEMLEQLKEGW